MGTLARQGLLIRISAILIPIRGRRRCGRPAGCGTVPRESLLCQPAAPSPALLHRWAAPHQPMFKPRRSQIRPKPSTRRHWSVEVASMAIFDTAWVPDRLVFHLLSCLKWDNFFEQVGGGCERRWWVWGTEWPAVGWRQEWGLDLVLQQLRAGSETEVHPGDCRLKFWRRGKRGGSRVAWWCYLLLLGVAGWGGTGHPYRAGSWVSAVNTGRRVISFKWIVLTGAFNIPNRLLARTVGLRPGQAVWWPVVSIFSWFGSLSW